MSILSLSSSISTNTHSSTGFVFNRQALVSFGFSPWSISPHGAFEQGPKTTTEILSWAGFHYHHPTWSTKQLIVHCTSQSILSLFLKNELEKGMYGGKRHREGKRYNVPENGKKKGHQKREVKPGKAPDKGIAKGRGKRKGVIRKGT